MHLSMSILSSLGLIALFPLAQTEQPTPYLPYLSTFAKASYLFICQVVLPDLITAANEMLTKQCLSSRKSFKFVFVLERTIEGQRSFDIQHKD